jgi:hypothetical protein
MTSSEKQLVPVPHGPWKDHVLRSYDHSLAPDRQPYELTDEDAEFMAYGGKMSMSDVLEDIEWAANRATTPSDGTVEDKAEVLKTRFVATVTPLAKRAVETLTTKAM